MNGLHPLMHRMSTTRVSAAPPVRRWISNCPESSSALLNRIGSSAYIYHIGNRADALLIDQVYLCSADGQRWILQFYHPVLAAHLTSLNHGMLPVFAEALPRVQVQSSEQQRHVSPEIELRRTSTESIAAELLGRQSVTARSTTSQGCHSPLYPKRPLQELQTPTNPERRAPAPHPAAPLTPSPA